MRSLSCVNPQYSDSFTLVPKRLATALPSLLAILASVLMFSASAGAQPENTTPNIVFIMTDDVGYGDIGSYGAPDIRTPNIDQMARDGTQFSDFYSNGPSCTPTRAGFITGRYQQRYGL